MGLIFARLRKKKTTDEILEDIQNDIQALEENRDITLQRQKYLIGRLYVYSIVFYIISAVFFYFCFFPVSLADRLFYVIPLLGFPVIVILMRKIISWHYKREIGQSRTKLSDLKTKKKQILEDVMNKETYKVAKEILEKYAPEQLKKNNVTTTNPLISSPRVLEEQKHITPNLEAVKGPRPPTLALPAPPGMTTPQKNVGPRLLQRQPSPQRRLVRPIIPRERNFFDKIIESLVGDGPNNRYALICRNCSSHNGMALKEDFDYLAFRCAYCGFPNPAQKVRPRPSVHVLSSRASSEDRRSENERRSSEIEEDNRSVDGESGRESDATFEDKKSVLITRVKKPNEDDETSHGEAGSSDDSSATADGIRTRKPLHLADD